MTDGDDLALIEQLRGEAVRTLLIQNEQGAYPYEVTNGKPLPPPARSMSTYSMVAHTVACLDGRIRLSALAGVEFTGTAALLSAHHLRCLKATARLIVSRIVGHDQRDSGPFDSAAFGKADPMTLCWLSELLAAVAEPDPEAHRKAIDVLTAVAARRVRQALERPEQPVMQLDDPQQRVVLHPLPLLRLVILNKMGGGNDEIPLAPAFEWFMNMLYLQLSRRTIEHSGFDAAELALSLEGILATSATSAPRPVIDGVLTALEEARQSNLILRPVTPFKVTASGAVHLYTSSEVVASLLRSAAHLEALGRPEFFVALKPALRDYLNWLRATLITGTARLPAREPGSSDQYPPDTPLEFAGWQSEHAHTEDGTIHVWLTSQMIMLLSAYHTLLSRDLARRALGDVGVLPAAAVLADPAIRDQDHLDSAMAQDPLQLGQDSAYRVASQLERLFIQPQRNGSAEDAAYSCLLYGPPGTGKTTLARRLADRLGWPLLTVTTSDFILDGESQVEARAKRLFDALNRQSKMVIFFDEIDRLVLDRDAHDYTRQGDMLQFMTPSMLTKINDLRALHRSIFVIGTNYADRIDSAIKRAGRIDHRLLVLPPDLTRREAVLRDALQTWLPDVTVPEDDVRAAAVKGALQTVAALRSAVRSYARVRDDLASHVEALVPAVSLEAYELRIMRYSSEEARYSGPAGTRDVTYPAELLEEVFLLTYLLMEGRTDPLPEEYDWVWTQWARVRVKRGAIVRDSRVVEKLDEIVGRR